MDKQNSPKQFEVILDHFKDPNVSGGNLIGDIDYMFGWSILLLPQDENLKTILLVTPSITTTDTSGTIVEAEVEIILNIYKYEYPFTDMDLYGLFCHSYIVAYHVIGSEIERQNILHNTEVYRPTMTIPSFEKVKEDILREIKKVYG